MKYIYFVSYQYDDSRIRNCEVELDREITRIEDIVEVETRLSRVLFMTPVNTISYHLLRTEQD